MITDEKGRPLTYWGGLDKSKKQTAVEWFAMITKELGYVSEAQLEQALKMEKEQVIMAYKADLHPCSDEDAEQYYNETFKQQEQ
jgi:hypothetical protein